MRSILVCLALFAFAAACADGGSPAAPDAGPAEPASYCDGGSWVRPPTPYPCDAGVAFCREEVTDGGCAGRLVECSDGYFRCSAAADFREAAGECHVTGQIVPAKYCIE